MKLLDFFSHKKDIEKINNNNNNFVSFDATTARRYKRPPLRKLIRTFKMRNFICVANARGPNRKTRFCISKLLLLQSAIARRPPESRRDYAGRGPDYSGRETWYPLCKFCGCVRACVRTRARSVWRRTTLCNPIKADKKSQLSNASD